MEKEVNLEESNKLELIEKEEEVPETSPSKVLKWLSQFSYVGRILLTMYSVYGIMILFGWDMQYIVFISTTNYSSKIVGSIYIILYTLYGITVSNVILIPLWDFFKFPYLKKSNCFNSITYLLSKIFSLKMKYEKSDSKEIYNIESNNNCYILTVNIILTIFSCIWIFLIGYAYAGFNYTPFDYLNSTIIVYSLSYYLLLHVLYELYFLVKLFKLLKVRKQIKMEMNDGALVEDEEADEKKENFPYTTQKSNVSECNQGEVDQNDPFLKAFDQTFNKIVSMMRNWNKKDYKKYTHGVALFTFMFIIQSLSFLILVYSLLCQWKLIHWYTWVLSMTFFSMFFIPSFTLRFPNWIVTILFRCCIPKKRRKKQAQFGIFPLLAAFVYSLIILVELILFVLFVFVPEADYSKIIWTPPTEEFNRTKAQSRDYIKPTFCFTKVHHVSILQLIAFANDAYYNEGNGRNIDYMTYSFFKDSDIKIYPRGNLTGNATGATMVRYDLDIPNSSRNVTILSIRGTSTNVDWWLDFQLFFSSALLTVTKNAVPLLTKSDSKTYQFASFLFSIPTRSFIELSLIDDYMNTLQKAYKENLASFGDNTIIFVGHSLGGGLAKIMGKMYVKESVSLSGPGISIFNHLWNPDVKNYNENFPISFIDIVPDMDLVPRVEVSGGTYYRIICDAGSGQCHSALRSLCMGAIMCHEDAEYVCMKSFNYTQADIDHMKKISNINGDDL